MDHLGQGPVAQGLMGPLVVVEPEVGSQFPPYFCVVGVGFQVRLFVLSPTPQPLDPFASTDNVTEILALLSYPNYD